MIRHAPFLLVPFLFAFFLAWSAVGQCPVPSQGPILSVGPYAQLGGSLHLGLSGPPLSLFALGADSSNGPIPTAFGNLCLGPNFFLFVDPKSHPFAILPPSGTFQMTLGIPEDPAFIGQTWHFQGAVASPLFMNGGALSNGASLTIQASPSVTIVFTESFEPSSPNFWSVSNGIWAIGAPTAGPSGVFDGTQCAATNLHGNYPATGPGSRLEGPIITLPTIPAGEELRMNYRMWFSTEDTLDWCRLEVLNLGTLPASWQTVPASVTVSGNNTAWTQFSADLTPYAGQPIRLGFNFDPNTCQYCNHVSGHGVFIDSLEIFHGAPHLNVPEDWESGMGRWWSCDNGVWQVGTPGSGGPSSVPSGTQCAGTYLGANYACSGANTRLISPVFQAPSTPFPQLRFWHWFSLESNVDHGRVQVRTVDPQTRAYSPWTTIGSSFTGGSGWTQTGIYLVDLMNSPPAYNFVGQHIQLGFYLTSSTCQYCNCYGGAGWFLDDIDIVP